MPIGKTYKRYGPLSSFGIVSSTRCNIIMVDGASLKSTISSLPAVYGVTAALENAIVWDVRKAEKVLLCFRIKCKYVFFKTKFIYF